MLKIVKGIENWSLAENCVITIGSFDGIHKAHTALINRMTEDARKYGGVSVLLSFEPHPRMILPAWDAYSEKFALLSVAQEKELLLCRTTLDYLLILPFDRAFAQMSPDLFISDIVWAKIRPKKVWVGYNNGFGKDRSGGFCMMKNFGEQYGFEVESFPEHIVAEEHLSSTQIRKHLSAGEIVQANALLGYSYTVYGILENKNFHCPYKEKLLPGPATYRVSIEFHEGTFVCRCTEDGQMVFLQAPKEFDKKNIYVKFIERI